MSGGRGERGKSKDRMMREKERIILGNRDKSKEK